MIGVLGLGFVGLTTCVGFAVRGMSTIGYDVDDDRRRKIAGGSAPFFEKGFDEALGRSFSERRFSLASSVEELVRKSGVIVFCVGTPSTHTGEVDLGHLEKAVKAVSGCIDSYRVLVIKSTVPPGTTQNHVRRWIEDEGLKVTEDVGLAGNPEFLREGFALEDFLRPDRIVIGESDKKSGNAVEEIYRPFGAPIVRVSLSTAEFIKYLSNTLLSTMISFSNEMATVAENIGDIDVERAFRVLHQDRRWSGEPAPMTSYVYPGCGYGGSCLPKDTFAIEAEAVRKGVRPHILEAVSRVNRERKVIMVDRFEKLLGGLKGRKVAVLGLSFKPGTDDVRETPSSDIIEELTKRGATVRAYDPIAADNFRESFPTLEVELAASMEEAIQGVGGIFIATSWPEFRKVAELFPNVILLDGRYGL